jgi:hypothetical protein
LPDGTYIFKPKSPIWVNFGGSCNGSCWFILWPFGIGILPPLGMDVFGHFGAFGGHLVYFSHFGMLY